MPPPLSPHRPAHDYRHRSHSLNLRSQLLYSRGPHPPLTLTYPPSRTCHRAPPVPRAHAEPHSHTASLSFSAHRPAPCTTPDFSRLQNFSRRDRQPLFPSCHLVESSPCSPSLPFLLPSLGTRSGLIPTPCACCGLLSLRVHSDARSPQLFRLTPPVRYAKNSRVPPRKKPALPWEWPPLAL